MGVVEPRYISEATVLPFAQEVDVARAGENTAAESAPKLDLEAVKSQIELIASRDLARQAIRKLDLLGNPEFNSPEASLSPIGRLLMFIGVRSDLRNAPPEDRVLAAYYDRLQVDLVANARLLRVKFSASNPDFAAKAANVIAELYLQMRGRPRRNDVGRDGERLADSLEALKRKAAEAEHKVEIFRAQSGPLIGDNKLPMTEQRLSALTKQLATARKIQADSRAKANLIMELLRQGRDSAIPDVVGDAPIRRVALQSSALHDQFVLDSQTYLPRHPRMQELRAQIAYFNNALRTQAERVARGLENESRAAGASVEALTASLNSQQREVAALNAQQMELRALERDAAGARDQLDSFRLAHGEALTKESSDAAPVGAALVARAVPAQLPSFPKDIPALVVSAFGGFLLSFGAIVAHEVFHGSSPPRRDRGVDRRVEAIDVLLDRAAATPQPPADSRPAATPIAATAAASTEADAREIGERQGLAALAARIEQLKRETRGVSALVCGLDRAAASAAAAIEISRILASANRAILVDVEDEGPGFGGLIAEQDGFGVADVLAGRKSPAEAVHHDLGSSLSILPAGRRRENEKIDRERLDAVLEALIGAYDIVVINGPPLADGDRSLDFARWTDAIVLVASSGVTGQVTLTAIDKLVDAGAMNVQVLTADDGAKSAANSPAHEKTSVF